jgi:hypothetical protein
MLPYLKELTQSQIDRGLIKFVHTLFSLIPHPVAFTDFPHSSSTGRGDEEVSTFRDLLQKA